MQNLIFCKINMFDAQQTVYKIDGSGRNIVATADMENLGHTIATACENAACYNVRLDGNRAYTEEIADDIRVTYSLMYHNNREINIEVSVEGE